MSIAQTNSPVSTIAGIPITSLTVDELEALLKAAVHSLLLELSLYDALIDCNNEFKFDSETLGELENQRQSRFELTGLASAIAHRLHELESKSLEVA